MPDAPQFPCFNLQTICNTHYNDTMIEIRLEIPESLNRHLEAKVASGEYASTDDVIQAAIISFHASQNLASQPTPPDHIEKVRYAIAQADSGDLAPLDMDAIKRDARKRWDDTHQQ